MQMIVLGMHRSGTSALARVLNLMGAYFGPEGVTTGANQENPKGFWERRDVRALNDSILHAAGCDWNRVADFDVNAVSGKVLEDFNRQAAKLVLELDGHRPWMIKEPRLCLLLPLWRRFLEVPVGIHIYRNPVEVASSLHRRNGIPLSAGLALWEHYVRSALKVSEGMPRVVVLYRQLVEAPMDAVGKLFQELVEAGVGGLRMPSEREIAAFIERDLYRERESRSDLRAYAGRPQVALFEALQQGQLIPEGKRDEEYYGVLEKYEASLAPMGPTFIQGEKVTAIEESLREQLSLREREVELVREFYDRREADMKRQEDIWGKLEQQHQQRIAVLEQGIRARDERIKVLEAAHQQDRELIGTHEAGIRARDERIKVLEAAHQQDRELVGMHEAEIRARDERIEALEESVRAEQIRAGAIRTAADEKVASLSSQVEAMANERNALREELAAVDAAMLDQRSMLARREQESALAVAARLKVEQALQVRHQEIAVLTKLLLESRSELAALTARVETYEVHSMKLAQMRGQLEAELAEIKRGRAWRLIGMVRSASRSLGVRKMAMPPLVQNVALVRDSGLFDVAWYLRNYSDVADSGVDPVEHFLRFGASELRDPGPGFSTAAYLRNNPDVLDSGVNPLLHYIGNGKSEGRSPK
ncbi:hypothetical protein [Stenotrophomonas acidaminiphila]